MLPTKFRFIWPSGFRGTDICIQKRVIFLLTEEKIFLEINQSETRIACGGHVC
jgi:hypothetical protein